MYKLHNRCRSCGFGPQELPDGVKAAPSSEKLVKAFSLGLQPLANDFCKEGDQHAGFFPLDVLVCPRCNLAQLSVVVDPSLLYRHYLYRTSSSRMMEEHFAKLVEVFKRECADGNILEIGSNDGRFLHYLKKRGYKNVCGIDPAENLATQAGVNDVPSIIGLFDGGTAEKYRQLFPYGADLVVARHVFCHIDDWHSFIHNLEAVTNPDSVVAIEVPWVQNLIDRYEWDTVYHEHTSYFSFSALSYLLKGTAFEMHDAMEFPIHGGAILVLLTRKGSNRVRDNGNIDSFLKREKCSIKEWIEFDARATANIQILSDMVRGLVDEGKRVAGYGASAKSTVAINACGFTKREVAYVTDNTPEKLYRFIPGTDIPILWEGAHVADIPDYMVCFAWNFMPEILEKNQAYLKAGGKFIVPIPEPRIVP